MEKHILGSGFARKELHVVNDQHIDQLIEVNEIVSVVFLHRINVLLGENFSRDIQYCFFRVLVFYFNPNGMSQVGFS